MTLRLPAFNDAKSYGFEWLRATLEADNQEGVLNAGDLKVTAAAAGLQRVDIAAGSALVKGDSGVPGTGLSQGLYLLVNDAAVANAVTLNASDATNPRLDQIVLRVRDSSDLGSGADDAVFEVITGAPAAGATLDNRNGAPGLTNDRIRLADVLVPAGSTAVSAGNVRDRRPWARGYHGYFTRKANAAAGNDYTTASASFVSIDATNLAVGVEVGLNPVKVTVAGRWQNSGVSKMVMALYDNTALIDGEVGPATIPGAAATDEGFFFEWRVGMAAGRHVLEPRWLVFGGTGTLRAQATIPFQMTVEENVRQTSTVGT